MNCNQDCNQGRECKCEALIQASAAAREAGCWYPQDEPATGFTKWAGAIGFAVGAVCAVAMGLALGYAIAKDWGVL